MCDGGFLCHTFFPIFHTSFFKFVQGTFIFLIMLFSVVLMKTNGQTYVLHIAQTTYTNLHTSLIPRNTKYSFGKFTGYADAWKWNFYATFFLICIKIKTQTKYDIWTQIIFLIYISIVTEKQSYINSYHFSDINFFQHFFLFDHQC